MSHTKEMQRRREEALGRELALASVAKAYAAQRAAERHTLEMARRANKLLGVPEANLAAALGISRPTLRKRLTSLDTDEFGTPPIF